MSRRRAVLCVIATILTVVAVVAIKRYFSPDAAIHRMFRDAANAVANERIVAASSCLSRRYSDPLGQSYESVLGSLHGLFEGYDDPRLSFDLSRVSRSGRTATVDVSFRLTASVGGRSEAIIGSLLDPAHAVLELREEGGKWRIERAITIETSSRTNR